MILPQPECSSSSGLSKSGSYLYQVLSRKSRAWSFLPVFVYHPLQIIFCPASSSACGLSWSNQITAFFHFRPILGIWSSGTSGFDPIQSKGGWGRPSNRLKGSSGFLVGVIDVDARMLVGLFLCHTQVLGRVFLSQR